MVKNSQPSRLDKEWKKTSDVDFTKPSIKWFLNGKLNVSYNCLDRHIVNGDGDRIALYWEGNDTSEDITLSYKQLYGEVNKFANVLKKNKITKGDRVCLHMQMIPELPIAMLACARMGAVHSRGFWSFQFGRS